VPIEVRLLPRLGLSKGTVLSALAGVLVSSLGVARGEENDGQVAEAASVELVPQGL
jgi:hypothetical protein